jgi:hypothetical protein
VTTRDAAFSISRPVKERLQKGPDTGQVLAVFEHACHLMDREGELTALVTPLAGDGPLNTVVPADASLFHRARPGTSVTLEAERVVARDWRVDLTGAAVWEPRPDWDALRARRAAIRSRLPLLRALSLRYAPKGSLLALFDPTAPADRRTELVLTRAQQAAEALRAAWEGDPQCLQEAIVDLIGLGNGLTPAGDDFIGGAMLWAWLVHPTPETFGRIVAQEATARTTTLSAALLRAAARGEFCAHWHTLLDLLCEAQEYEMGIAVRRILAQGATSGADSLSGFLSLST